MPIHDWTRVDAGLFHNFHQSWTVALNSYLNTEALPSDYFALLEQNSSNVNSDFRRNEADIYADKANRITVRHRHGDVVAVIEILSPGNKGSRADFRAFVEKSAALIRHGIHLLAIDPFPPGPRDPQGIHKAIWDEFQEEELDRPADKPLTLAAYDAGPPRVAYVEWVAVGDVLPDMPIFLKPEIYVPAPLEATYRESWKVFPAVLRGLLENPLPSP